MSAARRRGVDEGAWSRSTRRSLLVPAETVRCHRNLPGGGEWGIVARYDDAMFDETAADWSADAIDPSGERGSAAPERARLADRLRRAGLRITAQRLVILAAAPSGEHVSADALFAQVKHALPRINRATVYRTMEQFRDAGLVSETDLGGGAREFELLDDRHHHLICQSCGDQIELDDAVLEPMRAAILRHHGFSARIDHLALFGTCIVCQARSRGDDDRASPGTEEEDQPAFRERCRVEITRAGALSANDLAELGELLAAVVDAGASVGFLPPLTAEAAEAYWRGVNLDPGILLLARRENRIVGTVQVQPAESANGAHRAEIAKLLVDPEFQRRGIGRQLMLHAELAARRAGKTLLTLDTREGDPSNALYLQMGYRRFGHVPGWAMSATGHLAATVFYAKRLPSTD